MIKKRYVFAALTITFVLLGSLVYSGMTRRQIESTYEYDNWVDVNDDGVIDIFDLVLVANHYGAEGTPVTKAGLLFDSGWVNITDNAGQYFNITHNLNSTDWNDTNLVVDITGKTSIDGETLLRYLGLTYYTPGWNKTYGGVQYENARSMIQSVDGGYVLAGWTGSFGAGNYDFWLVKTDADGNHLWNQTYGGTNKDVANSIVQSVDGGYALAGDTLSFGVWWDFWLVKVDSSGNMQWNRTYGGTNVDICYSMVQTSDGGYALAGYTGSFTPGDWDFWLVKVDSSGNMQWNRTYGGTHEDNLHSVIQTSDGGYALAGYTKSFGAGDRDFWLVKVDSAGNHEWNRTYGGPSVEMALSVVHTEPDGGYAIAGHTQSYGAGSKDFWLVKVDSAGNHEWNRTYGGSNNEEVYSMVQTGDGGYALAGYTNSFGVGGVDSWLVKTDSTGNMQWNQTCGGANSDVPYSMVQSVDGGYALVGYTESFGAGNHDFWLVKTEVESGLAWTDSTADTITLYRGATDGYWNHVRVRIWKIKETP